VGLILARMDSKRLPGKPLEQAGTGVVLDFVIERARKISGLDSIVIATTIRDLDDPLIEFADSASIECYRGDAKNVAKRALDCVTELEADYFVRLNADSPYLQPELISRGVDIARFDHPDLVSNIFPRSFPYGISVEVVSSACLSRSITDFNELETENLTSYFYNNAESFLITNIEADREYDLSTRLVVDTPEDLKNFRSVASYFGANFSSASLPQILRALGSEGGIL
jgi:spore coat polysaccharide biosynthesis protein SpsF